MQDDRLSKLTRDSETTAPVHFPHEESLAVHLVPMSLVEELDSLRATYTTDLSLVMMLIGVLAGNILALLQLVEPPQLDKFHFFLAACFIVLFAHSTHKLRKEKIRANNLKTKLLNEFK